ncbi:MAG: succinylglutamate desuccinylase/aspartoacylase family protein [Bdellovibrionales bacterium]|nr:succinylglutamate desuccinylase/aspartoacylase family protein [Bdellovibrionales bacterium]
MNVDPTENHKQSPGTQSSHPALHKASPLDETRLPAHRAQSIDYGDGTIAIMRSFYADFVKPMNALSQKFAVTSLGNVEYGPHQYPLYQVEAISDPALPFVRLSGLVHGDEEAGGKALLEFLRDGIDNYVRDFNFIVNPCVNPSGYETATLQAMNGYHPQYRTDKNTGNINRRFGGPMHQQEALLLEEALRSGPKRYLVAMDLHESPPYYQDEVYSPADAPKEAWLYESARTPDLRIGRYLTDTLPAHIEACKWDTIYSDTSDHGVIAFSSDSTKHAEYTENSSLDGYVFERYTDHSFTFETPTGWKLEKRIEAQLHFVRTVLNVYRDRLKNR